MPPKVKVSKDKIAKAAASGAKAKKRKWSKGKTRDKLNNSVILDKATYEKLLKDVPSMKLITVSVISDRFKANGSLARAAIKELETKGLIRRVAKHHSQLVYTRSTATKQDS